MREIKFRVWDKNENNMLEMGEMIARIQFFDTPYISAHQTLNEGVGGIDYGNIELMQFTGLKDKNGKEIYEGDIVNFGNSNGFSWGTEYYELEIIWEDAGFRYKNIKTGKIFDKKITQKIINNCNKFEIIGNKFENPELLDANSGGSK